MWGFLRITGIFAKSTIYSWSYDVFLLKYREPRNSIVEKSRWESDGWQQFMENPVKTAFLKNLSILFENVLFICKK